MRDVRLAWVLWLVTGLMGGHRLYAGKVGTGLLMLATGGGGGVWWLIDAFFVGDDLVVGAGFSGSGFKHSPATGRMLAALALGRERELDGGFGPERYALRRFDGVFNAR